MSRPLGKYSAHTIDTVQRYCLDIQESLMAKMLYQINQELAECKGHKSEYDLKLFVHTLKKRISSIKLL